MELVTMDSSAEENGLATMIAALLQENVANNAHKAAELRAIETTFSIEAPDAGVAVTLQFSGGACTVLGGRRREAEVVITAPAEQIPELSTLPMRHGLPWVFNPQGKALGLAFAKRQIKIAGLLGLWPRGNLRRLRDLLRLVRVLSVA